jgi:hypothetical protein
MLNSSFHKQKLGKLEWASSSLAVWMHGEINREPRRGPVDERELFSPPMTSSKTRLAV